MKVHVVLTNNFKSEEIAEIDKDNTVCAVIDTIRATSTIVTMIGCGANSVIIAEDKAEAFALKKIFPDYILCGEEWGLAPEGFDYGNSPVEVSGLDARGKDFILMTTNGTRSILRAADFSEVFIMSILNLNHVLDIITDNAKLNFYDILILCSGERNRIAYDDAYNAGLAVKYLLTRPFNFEYTDSARLVLSAALSEFDVGDALEKSSSARSLREVSNGEDISFLGRSNIYKVAPNLSRIEIKALKKAGEINSVAINRSGKGHVYVIKNIE